MNGTKHLTVLCVCAQGNKYLLSYTLVKHEYKKTMMETK